MKQSKNETGQKQNRRFALFFAKLVQPYKGATLLYNVCHRFQMPCARVSKEQREKRTNNQERKVKTNMTQRINEAPTTTTS
jgi:hypothetical protein